MIKVAITGGISSGKSTVSKIFEKLGIPVFNTDLHVKYSEKDEDIIEAYKEILGDDIFINGELDRPKMRNIIFKDKKKLFEINNLMIPYIKKKFKKFISENSKSPYVLLESAIIFETHTDNIFDYIIGVTSDINIRIDRTIKRDGLTLEEIQNKLNNQMNDKERLSKSDFIIVNDGTDLNDSMNKLENKVIKIHDTLLKIYMDKLRNKK
jgi:dephospho-CoA kinase